jgi:hypothetical protein
MGAAMISACSLLIDVSDMARPRPAGVDAGADASTSEQGSSLGWCEQQGPTLFCDDFDEHALPGPWDNSVAVAAVGHLASDGVKSSPNAFVATVNDSNPGGHVALDKSFGVPPNAVHLAFDWRPDSIDSNPGRTMRTAEMQLISTEGFYYLQFGVNSDGSLYIDEQRVPNGGGGGVAHHPLSVSAAVGTWLHVQIDARLVGTPSVTVLVDGNDAVTAALSPLSPKARVVLYLGATYTPNPSAGWQFRFDNVTFAMD